MHFDLISLDVTLSFSTCNLKNKLLIHVIEAVVLAYLTYRGHQDLLRIRITVLFIVVQHVAMTQLLGAFCFPWSLGVFDQDL